MKTLQQEEEGSVIPLLPKVNEKVTRKGHVILEGNERPWTVAALKSAPYQSCIELIYLHTDSRSKTLPFDGCLKGQ